jgi:hypothetical protein
MGLKATDVFVPGSYPQYTYVERTAQGLEANLRDALSTPGQVISLSGPSKSGKTVLVERVVGRDLLITVSGASIKDPDDVWQHVLDWMDIPSSITVSRTQTGTVGGEAEVRASAGVPIVAKGEVTASVRGEIKREAGTDTIRVRRGLSQVVDEIANSDFVVLLDDFHYMDRSVQSEVAKALKEAVRLGVKIVTAAVTHRGDDVVRANPELRGRVRSIDLKYWTQPELQGIADSGFAALRGSISSGAVDKFINESAGSPQLMQLLCLQACFVVNLREETESQDVYHCAVDEDLVRDILQQTSASTDFRSLVDVLDSGPKTRGMERKPTPLTTEHQATFTAQFSEPQRVTRPVSLFVTRIS